MRLFDLYCGAGGAAMGYHRAGFTEIVGVDMEPQPHYPFRFLEADALTVLKLPGWVEGFDLIHASPPCKAFTKTGWAIRYDYRSHHTDLLTPTRRMLELTGTPWVIENVPGAPMRPDVVLCGSQFGLGVRRHRWFEVSWPELALVPGCLHDGPVYSPHGNPNRFKGTRAQWAEAMGIDWMATSGELSQAIPPAYTEYIGALFLEREVAV
jgi:DNA (cytosine-5)-methyltransferase 1